MNATLFFTTSSYYSRQTLYRHNTCIDVFYQQMAFTTTRAEDLLLI